jgi:hypothetical protein
MRTFTLQRKQLKAPSLKCTHFFLALAYRGRMAAINDCEQAENKKVIRQT